MPEASDDSFGHHRNQMRVCWERVSGCAERDYPRYVTRRAAQSWERARPHSWRWCVSSECHWAVASCRSSSAGCRIRQLTPASNICNRPLSRVLTQWWHTSQPANRVKCASAQLTVSLSHILKCPPPSFTQVYNLQSHTFHMQEKDIPNLRISGDPWALLRTLWVQYMCIVYFPSQWTQWHIQIVLLPFLIFLQCSDTVSSAIGWATACNEKSA